MSSSNKPHKELRGHQYPRVQNLLRSSTNHATSDLNAIDVNRENTFAPQRHKSRNHQRTRSASPKHSRENSQKLSFDKLPSFKKKPGRSLHDLKSQTYFASDHDNPFEIDIPDNFSLAQRGDKVSEVPSLTIEKQSSTETPPMTYDSPFEALSNHTSYANILRTLESSQRLLEASQNDCRIQQRQLTNLYKQLETSNMENADLKRKINMMKSDRIMSSKREEESEEKNRKLVESIERITEGYRKYQELIQTKYMEELQALQGEKDREIQELKDEQANRSTSDFQ